MAYTLAAIHWMTGAIRSVYTHWMYAMLPSMVHYGSQLVSAPRYRARSETQPCVHTPGRHYMQVIEGGSRCLGRWCV